MKKIITIWILLVTCSLFFYATTVKASPTDFSLSYVGQPGPLFTETNLAPGDIRTKTVQVTNNSSNDKKFGLNLTNFYGSSNQKLASVLDYHLSRNNILIASGNISDLKDQETNIETIPAGQTYVYNFAIEMMNVGNDYQAQNLGFDITFGQKDVSNGFKAILGASTGPTTSVTAQELPQTGSDIDWLLITIIGLILTSCIYNTVHTVRQKITS